MGSPLTFIIIIPTLLCVHLHLLIFINYVKISIIVLLLLGFHLPSNFFTNYSLIYRHQKILITYNSMLIIYDTLFQNVRIVVL